MVLAAIVIAVGVAALLLVGSLTAPTRAEGGRRPFYFGQQPPPDRRPVELVQQRAPEAFRPIIPLQRDMSDAGRDAAGYLLIILGVAASLVLAREPVVAGYRASLGGWMRQLQILGTGLAAVGVIVSVLFLVGVVILGSITPFGRGLGDLSAAFFFQPVLQGGLIAIVVGLVFVGLVALVGFTAAAWRLGDALFGLRGLRRVATAVPEPLVAIIGATIIFLVTQIPYIGRFAALLAVAYALGAVMAARLGQAGERAAPPATS